MSDFKLGDIVKYRDNNCEIIGFIKSNLILITFENGNKYSDYGKPYNEFARKMQDNDRIKTLYINESEVIDLKIIKKLEEKE